MNQSIRYLVAIALLLPLAARAQMPHDAIYMGKGSVCVAGMYGRSTWDQYWENSLKRENLNIGTHTTQNVMLMPAIGITNRLNVILALPYVWTQTSAGNLMGQKGFQDLSGWLKYKVVAWKGFSLNAVAGASLPVGNYVPDFLPMSIGLQCRTAMGRLVANYKHPATGLYVTGHGSYIWRSNIKLDRDAYQANDRLYNTDEVRMPNAFDLGGRLGILRKMWQTEVWVERTACTSGDHIRRNDMPFPTNNMQATSVGWYGKVQPRNIGLSARVGYVVGGRNVGQSTSYQVGVLYLFKL
ncbi:transporter [Larkinella soli]|uniref:transporter n=1 Tax=Larkinella soli TaxID=1770527 RepID=UPI000FFC5D40|nr:transporter [Larkinella soli]